MAAMRRFMKVVWIGFWMNLCSGVLLFSIYPDKYIYNTLFRFKISFIVAGLLLGAVLDKTYVSVGDEYAGAGTIAPARAKALAALSLCCWISAIVAGRYMAYSTFADIGAGGG
jgi:predicted secreted protein